jgi:hypothetical protein
MASARAMIERRRSSRVATCIPVKVTRSDAASQTLDHSAEAIGVSRCGALLRVPSAPALGAPPLGSRIAVQNGFSSEAREFRVVRVSPTGKDGLFELGVEMLHPAQNFWGIRFPDEHSWVDTPPRR